MKVEHADWLAVKKASQVFDTGRHLLDTFAPRIAGDLDSSSNVAL